MSLAAWNARLDTAPPSSAAVVGRWLLWLGSAAMLWGIFLTPPWGLFGFALAVLGLLLARAPVHRLPALWVGLGLGAWVLASNLAGMWREQPGCGRLSGLTYTWFAVPLVAAAASDPRWRRFALRGLIVTGGAALGVGLAQFLIGLGKGPLNINPDGSRFLLARGFSSYHLSFGFAGAVLAALSVPVLDSAAWVWAGRCIGLVTFGICGARACLLGGTAAIGTALAARGRRWLVVAVVVVVVLGGALVARMALSDAGRLRSMLSGQDGRWPIWQVTGAMIGERPLLGIGHRKAFELAWNPLYERVAPGPPNEFGASSGCPHAHNWLLAVAAEHGLPAAALHLALVLIVLAALWRRRRASPEAFQAGCGLAVAALVCAMFEPLPIQAAPGMGFHAALGLVLGMAYTAEGRLTSRCAS